MQDEKAGAVARETFARGATLRALQRLRETRERGEVVVDEGDFVAREIAQLHMEAATEAERR